MKMTYDEYVKKAKSIGTMGELPEYYHTIDDQQLLTPNEISGIVGVHEETVRRWIRSGKLPAKGFAHYTIIGIELKRFLFQKDKKKLPV